MASDKEFLSFVLDQIENAGEITAKKSLENMLFIPKILIPD